MDLRYLKNIGLSDGEIRVYEAMLSIGASSLNKIQEKTGIERRNIYDILNKLIEKGLTTYTIEKSRKTFQITHPKKIISYLEDKKKEIEKVEKDIQPNIPSLTQLFNEVKKEIRAEVFRGNEAIKALLEEGLEYKENYWIGGNLGLHKYFPYWWKHFDEKRIKRKVFWYDLADHGLFWYKDLKEGKDPKKYYALKFLPPNLSSPMVIMIFGDKVAQILWGKQSFAFVLESKDIKESFMKYFYYFWKNP